MQKIKEKSYTIRKKGKEKWPWKVEPYQENIGPLVNVTIREESDPTEKDMAVWISKSPKHKPTNLDLGMVELLGK